MRRSFDSLNEEERMLVYDRNKKLREDVWNAYIDTEDYWVSEILNYISDSLQDYDIGYCGCRINGIKNYKKFIYGLSEIQHTFCFLPDTYNTRIEKIKKIMTRYIDTRSDYDYRTFCSDILRKSCDKLIEPICECFRALYNWTDDDEREMYRDFYASEMVGKHYFVDENFNLFKINIASYA